MSPHLDDAVLSCGGTVRRLGARGRTVTVATVFTEDPPRGAPLSALARRNHAAWGLGEAPFERRRGEDVEAAAALGFTPMHLGFWDAIYRVDNENAPLYSQVTGVALHPLDREELLPALAATMARVVEETPDARVFAPAAVGGHVDHRLVRAALEEVCESERLAYYEEFPYSQRRGEGPVLDRAAGRLRESVITLTDDELDARIAAIACYRSQLRGLFPSSAERAAEVLSARAPFVGQAVSGRPDELRSRSRMTEHVRRAVSARGGEAYWWYDTGQGPPISE